MDQENITMGKVWGTPGKWMRTGILQALALKIGDIVQVEKCLGFYIKSLSSLSLPFLHTSISSC